MANAYATLAVVLVLGGRCVGGGSRPPDLPVPRCCPAGHALSPDALQATTIPAADVLAACRPDEAMWQPRVYAPARGGYLERGRLPPHWRPAEGAVPGCALLHVLPEEAAPFALLANNGSLWVRSAALALPPARYCADARAALACIDEGVRHAPSKCCAENRTWDGAQCVPDGPRAALVLTQLRALNNDTDSRTGGGWPACAAGRGYADAGALAGGRLREDGALQLRDESWVPAGQWCAEAVSGAEGARVLVCGAGSARRGSRHVLYGCALAVGAGFLAATLAASLALPAAHHALHWRCQTHYVAALMLADLLLAGTHLAGDNVPTDLCKALAVCMHFLFLSAFFWLNTMCFNIWWTFRDFRPTSLERSQEAVRLRVYMVYAWGGPLALAGAAALLDHLPPTAAPLLRPRFAVQRCWFYGDMEILVYFFGPVGVLLLVNLALFLSTTRQLTCGLWRRDEVKSTSERAALGRVCAKLVVVMGVTWGADVVSWAAGGPEYVWFATDVLNALQGVLIFLVVGCQRHAWAALRRAAAQAVCCAQLGPAAAARRAARATHSSTHLPSCGDSLTHTTPAPSATSPPPAPQPPPALPRETIC